jgi:hypothetical protein
MAGRGSLAAAARAQRWARQFAANQVTCMVNKTRLSIAGGYGETRIHAVYSMGRTEDKSLATGSCGWSPNLEV